MTIKELESAFKPSFLEWLARESRQSGQSWRTTLEMAWRMEGWL